VDDLADVSWNWAHDEQKASRKVIVRCQGGTSDANRRPKPVFKC
jgi:hypothetical protein